MCVAGGGAGVVVGAVHDLLVVDLVLVEEHLPRGGATLQHAAQEVLP